MAVPVAYPKPTLTAIEGTPDPITIQLLLAEVFQNARSQSSELGGGCHGQLGIVLSSTQYLELTGSTFTAPTHPGIQATPPAFASDAQLRAADRSHDQHVKAFREYEAVRDSLKKQILDAVDERFYSVLKHPQFLYSDVMPLTILELPFTTYGQLTAEDLEKNRAKLRSEWNPDDGIEILWDRIRHCQATASGTTNEVTDGTAMALTLETLAASGVMTEYIRDWKMKPLATREKIDEFKAHFNEANKIRLEELTSKQAGFAAALQPQPPSNAVASAMAAAPSPASTDGPVRVDKTNMYYCHSHGLSFAKNHTSKLCNNKKEGHQDEATITKMMGGCRLINTGQRTARRTQE